MGPYLQSPLRIALGLAIALIQTSAVVTTESARRAVSLALTLIQPTGQSSRNCPSRAH